MENRARLLGFDVMAKGKKDKRHIRVNGPRFQTQSAAREFADMWKKSHPEDDVYVFTSIKGMPE